MKTNDRSISNDCIMDTEHLDIKLIPPYKNLVVQFLIDPYTKIIAGYKLVDEG